MKPQWVLEDRTPEVREMLAEVEAADGQRRALQAKYDRLISRWREARDLADKRLKEVETLRAELAALSVAFDILNRSEAKP